MPFAKVNQSEENDAKKSAGFSEPCHEMKCRCEHEGKDNKINNEESGIRIAEQTPNHAMEKEGSRHTGFEDIAVGDRVIFIHQKSCIMQQGGILFHAPMKRIACL